MFSVERRGEVALLRMDDGKVNAMGPRFVELFPAALREAEQSNAIVLAGNAKAFCAGLDLKTLPTLERADLLAFTRRFMGAFHELLACERPLVAAIDGPALAGGAVMALACDLRVVGPRARLGLTEIPVGIPFPSPVAKLALQRLPPNEHAPALLQGAIRTGEDGVARGWAHRFAPHAEADALALAAELAQFHPPAIESAKRALRGAIVDDFAAFAKDEADAWTDQMLAPGTFDAVAAYFMRATQK